MKYAQQKIKPEWFKKNNSKNYYSCTSGTHFLNEWYEFNDRDDALKFISETFTSQSFIDRFINWNGEYYYTEDVKWKGDIPLIEKATEADIQDMINAESPF